MHSGQWLQKKGDWKRKWNGFLKWKLVHNGGRGLENLGALNSMCNAKISLKLKYADK